jgi:two-component system, OmpR family, response regulator
MRLLLIEDEEDLVGVLNQALAEAGYAVDVALDGIRGLECAQNGTYDALILDLMLPGCDGWEVLRRLRQTSGVPVLILTARDAVSDRIRGLDLGADDYLVKPFDLAELLARLRAMLRRSHPEARTVIALGEVTVDVTARSVSRHGRPIRLTPREYELVEFLTLRRGQLVSRSALYQHLFKQDDDSLSNLMDVHISNVRKKLGKDFITTRRGEGYLVDV